MLKRIKHAYVVQDKDQAYEFGFRPTQLELDNPNMTQTEVQELKTQWQSNADEALHKCTLCPEKKNIRSDIDLEKHLNSKKHIKKLAKYYVDNEGKDKETVNQVLEKLKNEKFHAKDVVPFMTEQNVEEGSGEDSDNSEKKRDKKFYMKQQQLKQKLRDEKKDKKRERGKKGKGSKKRERDTEKPVPQEKQEKVKKPRWNKSNTDHPRV